jgi:hypothetical protein
MVGPNAICMKWLKIDMIFTEVEMMAAQDWVQNLKV